MSPINCTRTRTVVILTALVVVALTALSANASALPQVQIPSIPNLPLPGNGNNNNNGGNGGGNGSPAPSQPREDKCVTEGKCVPPGKSKTCIVPASQWRFKDFKDAYLPVDISPYFKDRFDGIFDASTFPKELRNASDLMELWGNKPWSYFGSHWKEFNRRQAGCELPTQRYYLTWAMIDMLEYFMSKGDHCASGTQLSVCADTFDRRIERVTDDIKNKTLCSGPREYEEAANKYIQRLKSHPFRSTSTSCISGAAVEGDLGKCGFYTEFAACQFKDGCADFEQTLAPRCPKILEDFRKAYQIGTQEEGTAGGTTGSNKGLIAGIVVGIIVFAVIIGLCMLKRTRVKSSNLKETLGRMTFGRTFGRQPSQPNVNGQGPPPPQIHFANSSSPAAASPAPVMSQQPPAYASAKQHGNDAHLTPQQQPYQPGQPSVASPHFSPRVSSSPAPFIAGAAVGAAAGVAAGVVYVNEYGQPVSPAMSPAVAPSIAPIVTQPGAPAQSVNYYDPHAAVSSPHQHAMMLSPNGSNAALMAAAPTASDAGSAQVMTSTTTQVDTHTHTTQQTQVHHQVQEETYVTTTTAVEEFVVYVDEHGNPCDEQGNPLPESMPEVQAMRAAQRGQGGVTIAPQ